MPPLSRLGIWKNPVKATAQSVAAGLVIDTPVDADNVIAIRQVALKFNAAYTGVIVIALMLDGATAVTIQEINAVAITNVVWLPDSQVLAFTDGDFFRVTIPAQAATTVDYKVLAAVAE